MSARPSVLSRRSFLKHMSAGTAAAIGAPSLLLPKDDAPLGVALCGLGTYSTTQLAPALQSTTHCRLRGIVTGSPEKIPVWQRRYDIPDRNVYSYDTLPDVANNDDIDVVYIVTPPGLHARDAIRAAKAGKHVWCEKPMAKNVAECQAIIDAADRNGVQLTIGYRMQHEPNTRTLIKYGQNQTYGAVTEVRSGAGFYGSFPDPDNWRRVDALGGGAIYDMGVYPINAARYATGAEPVAVRGRLRSDRASMFAEVHEHAEFELRFPDGVTAQGKTSFGASYNYLEVDATEGWYQLRPFQSYSGVQGETSDGTRLPPAGGNQQARQMDHDARAILDGTLPVVLGAEGLADVRIVEAIQASDAQGQAWVEL